MKKRKRGMTTPMEIYDGELDPVQQTDFAKHLSTLGTVLGSARWNKKRTRPGPIHETTFVDLMG
jgi:hypothetical protein